MSKSILELDQVVNILSDEGHTATIEDNDEYGASVSIKHNDKWLHIVYNYDLDGSYTIQDILDKASAKIADDDKPSNPNAEIVTENLMDYFN